MSVMFDRFFAIPQAAIRNGKAKLVGGLAWKVYTALCDRVEYSSSREVVLTVTQLKQLIGGSSNGHANARTELVAAGLVQFEPCGAQGFIFHICNPETGEPWPLHPKEKIPYVPKGSVQSVDAKAKNTARQPRKKSKIDDAGTSFNYGYNVTKAHPPVSEWPDFQPRRDYGF